MRRLGSPRAASRSPWFEGRAEGRGHLTMRIGGCGSGRSHETDRATRILAPPPVQRPSLPHGEAAAEGAPRTTANRRAGHGTWHQAWPRFEVRARARTPHHEESGVRHRTWLTQPTACRAFRTACTATLSIPPGEMGAKRPSNHSQPACRAWHMAHGIGLGRGSRSAQGRGHLTMREGKELPSASSRSGAPGPRSASPRQDAYNASGTTTTGASSAQQSVTAWPAPSGKPRRQVCSSTLRRPSAVSTVSWVLLP